MRMKNIMACWIGYADLRASSNEGSGIGPVAQSLAERSYENVILLSDHPAEKTKLFTEWLKSRFDGEISLFTYSLSSPTNFAEIYKAAKSAMSEVLEGYRTRPVLTFHLSPGTPAMAAVWMILAKTRYPDAELIESSPEHGVQTASFPFDISADFIPDLLRGPDDELERLSVGLPPAASEFDQIVHRSRVMKEAVVRARRAALRSTSVLIEGESGTGKELFAHAIRNASPRHDKPFIIVNCGAIPDGLVESELFGHEKGAFTGAISQKSGLFEAANGGTIFLDEIGELPKSAQVKLLRVLQEGEVLRVGTTEPLKVDVRVISATNRSLMEEVAEGGFREDLFYRLAILVLKLPSLRERAGDMNLMIDKLLERVNEESLREPGYEQKKLSAGARNILHQYSWPGNVRELLNTLRRAAVWSSGNTIRVEDMRDSMLLMPEKTGAADVILGKNINQGIDLNETISQVARHYLVRALEAVDGNKTQAAKLLSLPSYQTLNNWMKKYDVPG